MNFRYFSLILVSLLSLKISLFAMGCEETFLDTATTGNIQKAQEFLNSGTDINTCDKWGFTALHIACRLGHLEYAKMLVARGADINALSIYNTTPLHQATFMEQYEIVEYLTNLDGIKLNIQKKENNLTALHWLSFLRQTRLVQLLLEKGADSSLRTSEGKTASNLAN